MRTRTIHPLALLALIAASAAATDAAAQERGFLTRDSAREATPAPMARMSQAPPTHKPDTTYECRGPISRVMDVGYEGVKTTSYNFSSTGGGGESGRFDRTPC